MRTSALLHAGFLARTASLLAFVPFAAGRAVHEPQQVASRVSSRQDVTPERSGVFVSNHLKRDIEISNSCQGKYKNAASAALTEAAHIAADVYSRLLELEQLLRRSPVPDKSQLTPAERTLWNTFEAFYGQVYFGAGQDAQNNAGISRVEIAQSSVGKLRDYLRSPNGARVEIWCGDGFLSHTDPLGNLPDDLDLSKRFDSRKWTVDDPKGEWVKLTACDDDATMSAYHYLPNPDQFGTESVVVLCPNFLPLWSARYGVGDQVSKYHGGQSIAAGGTHLDHVWGYLPATILHEFSHSTLVMTGTAIYDKCLLDNRKAYQWQCIHQLSKEDTSAALLNSDTLSLFMTATYMNGNDWSTGISQPLGYKAP